MGRSPPVRRRGLKLAVSLSDRSLITVASRAEAWIETVVSATNNISDAVASRAEAWIETPANLHISLPPASRLPCGGVD